jgi:hypothetical protein
VHANLALGRSLAGEYKSIAEDPKDPRHPLGIKVDSAMPEEARDRLTQALTREPQRAAESLGHIRYRRRVEAFGTWLADHGDQEAAYEQIDVGIDALASRDVNGRRVKPEALDEMRQMRDSLRTTSSKKGKKR